MKNKGQGSKIIVLNLIISVFLVYWRWFLPFPHVANDLHVSYTRELESHLNIPFVWNGEGAVGMGESSVFSVWNWPVEALFGLLGNLGLSHNVLNQYLALGLGLLVGGYSVYLVSRYFKLGNFGRIISVVFYLVNTYVLLLVDGGQLSIALAYFWFPLAFLTVLKAVKKGFREKLLGGLAVSVLGFFDIRFVYVLFLLLLLKFLYDLILGSEEGVLELIKEWAGAAFVAGVVFAGLHAYWLYPALKVQAPTLPETYQRVSQTSFLSFAELGHGLFLQQPHWFKNVFGKVSEVKLEFLLIPILVFLAPVLVRPKNNKQRAINVGFWLLTALVGIFLVKGANPPLPEVYPWLFANVPGFSLFRDPTKFFFLVALSYAVLIGITVDELSTRLRRISEKVNSELLKNYVFNYKTLVFLIIAYLLLLINPVYTGRMTGTFSGPVYKEEFFEVADILREDGDFGRVFWIPTKAPLGYSSPTHPSVEASRLVQKRPFAIGTVGTYEQFNFLREAPFMGELFKVAGIDYIAYPFPDTRREVLKRDNIDYYHAFLDQLTNLPWIEESLSEPPVALLKTSQDAKRFFLSKNTIYVVGSDRIYNEIIQIPNFDLTQTSLIFGEERPNQLPEALENDDIKILAYESDRFEVIMSFVPEQYFIFPANQLDFAPNESGWWKREAADLINWRDFLQQKYGIDNLDFDYAGGWAVAEGNKQLTINNEQRAIDNEQGAGGNILIARVMESSRGGKVEFFQGEEKIGEIDTKLEEPRETEVILTGYEEVPDQVFSYDKANVRWFEVGRLVSDVPLTVKTSGDINVVNAVAVVPEPEWQSINELIDEYGTLNWENLSEEQKAGIFAQDSRREDDVAVDYKRISPTHYKVTVEGLKEPATLAFSETYDSLWKANGRASYPLYSLINGFQIEGDGEYDIVYSAQRYVLPGLYISGASLLGVIILLLYLRKVRS